MKKEGKMTVLGSLFFKIVATPNSSANSSPLLGPSSRGDSPPPSTNSSPGRRDVLDAEIELIAFKGVSSGFQVEDGKEEKVVTSALSFLLGYSPVEAKDYEGAKLTISWLLSVVKDVSHGSKIISGLKSFFERIVGLIDADIKGTYNQVNLRKEKLNRFRGLCNLVKEFLNKNEGLNEAFAPILIQIIGSCHDVELIHMTQTIVENRSSGLNVPSFVRAIFHLMCPYNGSPSCLATDTDTDTDTHTHTDAIKARVLEIKLLDNLCGRLMYLSVLSPSNTAFDTALKEEYDALMYRVYYRILIVQEGMQERMQERMQEGVQEEVPLGGFKAWIQNAPEAYQKKIEQFAPKA